MAFFCHIDRFDSSVVIVSIISGFPLPHLGVVVQAMRVREDASVQQKAAPAATDES